MVDKYDGGIQEETNSDLDITGSIDTGVETTTPILSSIATNMSVNVQKFKEVTILFKSLVDLINNELLREHKHVHQFHKHRSCNGHCDSSPLILKMMLNSSIFVLSGGKFFANGYQNTVVNLLLNEMFHAKDLDDNKERFFHDFIFDWDDPKLPPGIKQLKDNPFMPGSRLYPYTEDSYSLAFNEILIGYLDSSNLSGFRKPNILNRMKQCKIISWDDYYSGINEYYKQYLVI